MVGRYTGAVVCCAVGVQASDNADCSTVAGVLGPLARGAGTRRIGYTGEVCRGSNRASLLVAGVLLVASCSINDLDETVGGGNSGTDAGTSGGAGPDAADGDGSAGWPTGGTTGVGGAIDGGGSGGTPSGGSGGTPSGGGSGGAGGAGGTGATGGSAGCASSEKLCASQCVAKSPDNGCDASACTACSLPHAQAGCAAGQCSVAKCSSGYGNCDSNAGNGCETMLGTGANCKACGDACSAPIGTTACVSGACKVTACPGGRADCDGLAGNGCETDLTTTASCGVCGNQCPPGFTCHKPATGPNVCICSSDTDCLNGGVCFWGVCVCGGVGCPNGQRCTLISTCF